MACGQRGVADGVSSALGKGLCSICGINLNRGTCDCKREWEDPRLAVLKTLKRES